MSTVQTTEDSPPSQVPQSGSTNTSPIDVLAIPSNTIVDDRMIIGDSTSMSKRSYALLKATASSFTSDISMCEWHTPLPSLVVLPDMQRGVGAKPEWRGKHLVAIKRLKKTWESGWDECRKYPEIEILRTIPQHANIINLYDAFLVPDTKRLHLVFECMEGNLYHLIKSRKGRPFAGGLVSSIFVQVCRALAHIHDSGYFHRDMRPENTLITTTGLNDYPCFSPIAPPGSPPEKDVVVIVKLTGFNLAKSIKSKPLYGEDVSVRWYRAPENILRSKEYGMPVDLWALGAIMAETVNLQPLFPGKNNQDQLKRICSTLGDPSDYGFDSDGRPRGGGQWPDGLILVQRSGFNFDKVQPLDFSSLFPPSTPRSLVACIHSLLRYEPNTRLSARECLDHSYFAETNARSPLAIQLPVFVDPKRAKKESQKLQKEMNKEKKVAQEREMRERARAVMQKRAQIVTRASDASVNAWRGERTVVEPRQRVQISKPMEDDSDQRSIGSTSAVLSFKMFDPDPAEAGTSDEHHGRGKNDEFYTVKPAPKIPILLPQNVKSMDGIPTGLMDLPRASRRHCAADSPKTTKE